MRVTISLAACAILLNVPVLATAEPTTVRFAEGPAERSLILRSPDGKILANGNLVQTVRGGQVTSQVVFRFTDGSVHDETAVFSQNKVFRLLSYHLVQSGPSFRWTLDMTMDTETGRVIVRHKDRDGDEGVEDETLTLPADVANGMVPTVLKNLTPKNPPAAASFVAATPGVRLVKLSISSAGSEAVSTAGSSRRATHYVVKAEIGGVAGFIAPLVGKQPPDTHVWILEGDPPAFLRSQGPLFYGGPLWRVEVAK